MKKEPTAEHLRELLDYDPETGIFINRVKRNNNAKMGALAGTKDPHQGYLKIQFCGRQHLAHRLAWLYVYGVWPSGEIDHRNEIKHDNRLCNLRDVGRSINVRNRKDASKNNGLGVRHIAVHTSGKFRAHLHVDGRKKHLGCFTRLEDAVLCVEQAKLKYRDGL